MVKVCPMCGHEFNARESRITYCSGSCRSRASALKKGQKLHPKKKTPRDKMLERLAARDAEYAAWQAANGIADRSTVYAGTEVVNRGTVPVAARPYRNVLEFPRT